MRLLTLVEYSQSDPISLSIEQRDALKKLVPSLMIVPDAGSDHEYRITPGGEIGAVLLPELAVEIRPKIPIDRVLFLMSYALNSKDWRQLGFSFDDSSSLVEAVVPGFVAQLGRSLQRGLLQGYRREEEALMTVRGRIRFDEQLRRRNGVALPIEVGYDDFTEDILENQILLAALEQLRHIRIRSEFTQKSLRHFRYLLQHVSVVNFDSRNLPEISFSRLNQHYQPAIELAMMILRASSIELRHGNYEASAFLVNMNDVFESFVVTALRDSLGLTDRQFSQNAEGNRLHLDAAEQVRLKPDLFWLEQQECVFLGDVKYKRVNDAGVKHADLYQLLAYTIAADVSSGLLVYAYGEGESAFHQIKRLGKTLEVAVLDVSGTPDEILREVRGIAERVRIQRNINQRWRQTPLHAAWPT